MDISKQDCVYVILTYIIYILGDCSLTTYYYNSFLCSLLAEFSSMKDWMKEKNEIVTYIHLVQQRKKKCQPKKGSTHSDYHHFIGEYSFTEHDIEARKQEEMLFMALTAQKEELKEELLNLQQRLEDVIIEKHEAEQKARHELESALKKKQVMIKTFWHDKQEWDTVHAEKEEKLRIEKLALESEISTLKEELDNNKKIYEQRTRCELEALTSEHKVEIEHFRCEKQSLEQDITLLQDRVQVVTNERDLVEQRSQ